MVIPEKPKGENLIAEIKRLGFELPFWIARRLLVGDYVSFCINNDTDAFEFEASEYDPVVIYKTNYTAHNTLVNA